MNNLYTFAQESSSSKEQNGFITFMENVASFFAKLQGADIWVPILFVALIAISFLIGFIFKLKWTIFKLAAIILTIIGSVIFSVSISNYLGNREGLKAVVSLATTLFALILYLSLRAFFFVINSIIATLGKIFKFGKKKNKIKKVVWRSITGATNAVLTIPGILLFSNVLLIGSKQTEGGGFASFSKIGVGLLTGFKGQNIAGLLGGFPDLSQLLQNYEKITNIINKKPSEWTKEERELAQKLATGVASLLNDNRVRGVIIEEAKKLKLNESAKQPLSDLFTLATVRVQFEKPEYNLANEQDKKEIATKYFAENIARTYNELKTTKPTLDDDVQLATWLYTPLNEKAREEFNLFVSSAITDQQLRSKIDVDKSVAVIMDYLKEKELAKTQTK
ncbi:hypothetical protein [Mycoplasma procyoni]|uniref:hypothetical protein n=1 Tax=Mycoplasma procyoni TaxID=568784 RepID=UPI00197BB099|nr:hypothetical protein [Mycoplasma procyoni]MBN3534442.1 hypothetical protein [Mycoplasma procyoni]